MHHELLAPLAADLELVAQLGGGDAPVPACPGWTLDDLLAHVGGVARMAAASVRGGDDGARPRRSRPPEGADLAAWVRTGAADLLDALRTTDADAPTPAFSGPKPASWWAVRQAVEMALHRVDAEAALGRTGPVDERVAEAGIDEWFGDLCGDWHRADLADLELTLHLHAAEGGEWTARWAEGGYGWDRSHAKGDVAVRGPVSDLLLVLWGRPPLSAPEVLGDATAWERLLERTRT